MYTVLRHTYFLDFIMSWCARDSWLQYSREVILTERLNIIALHNCINSLVGECFETVLQIIQNVQ